MSGITSLRSTKGTSGTVEWQFDSKQIKLSIASLQQVMLCEQEGLVLSLSGNANGGYSDTLKAYEFTGELLFCVAAPDGFIFEYLTEHSDMPIAVVAGSECGEIDGWYDWHFRVNPQTGALTRHCPAY